MACSSCSTGTDGQPRGCKNNGTCGTDGCNKLTVFDWLSNMSLPSGQTPFDCVEVRFKNSRKEFFRNAEGLPLSLGDVVATQAKSGHVVWQEQVATRDYGSSWGTSHPCTAASTTPSTARRMTSRRSD